MWDKYFAQAGFLSRRFEPNRHSAGVVDLGNLLDGIKILITGIRRAGLFVGEMIVEVEQRRVEQGGAGPHVDQVFFRVAQD